MAIVYICIRIGEKRMVLDNDIDVGVSAILPPAARTKNIHISF